MIELFLVLGGLLVGAIIGFLFSQLKKVNSENPVEKEARNSLKSQLLVYQNDLDKERGENKIHIENLAAERQKSQALLEQLDRQKKELEQMNDTMKQEFKLLAQSIMEENSTKFVNQNRENLDVILNPLKEKIKDFEQKVDQTYKEDTKGRSELKAELTQLLKLNQELSKDAKNLTTALKGENKTQGNWGELVLERVLENSGLKKGIEYEIQYTTKGNEGQVLRPDVIIRLPDNKHIIVDSKVTLTAYERMVNAEDENERQNQLKQHILSIKNHVRDLHSKKYQDATGVDTLDFVLLFMPIESAFGVALNEDLELFNYSWDRKVVIVTPSTLLATLRTISSIWKQEHQNKNVMEIARLAGNLYDKFVAFTTDIQKVEDRIESASRAVSNARNKLSEGKGNMVSLATRTKELGVKSNKEFPKEMRERAKDQNSPGLPEKDNSAESISE